MRKDHEKLEEHIDEFIAIDNPKKGYVQGKLVEISPPLLNHFLKKLTHEVHELTARMAALLARAVLTVLDGYLLETENSSNFMDEFSGLVLSIR